MRMVLVPLALLLLIAPVYGQQAYILTVGYDGEAQAAKKHDHYAHDARDMNALLEKKSAHPVAAAYCVAGKEAKLATFLEKLDAIKNKATDKDVVVLFFSVHGTTSKKGEFSVSLADKSLTGKVLANAFDGIKANVVLLIDTCEAGGMLNHPTKNPNVCIMLGCKVDESTSGGKRKPLHGYYSNAIHAALSGAADQNKDGSVNLQELDDYLLNPRHVEDSKNQHAISSLPKQLKELKIAK